MKEAKAAETKAKADAKADRKVADARKDAAERTTEARKDATETKRDADYRVAVERCDSLAGDAKDACVRDAKARFGKFLITPPLWASCDGEPRIVATGRLCAGLRVRKSYAHPSEATRYTLWALANRAAYTDLKPCIAA